MLLLMLVTVVTFRGIKIVSRMQLGGKKTIVSNRKEKVNIISHALYFLCLALYSIVYIMILSSRLRKIETNNEIHFTEWIV